MNEENISFRDEEAKLDELLVKIFDKLLGTEE